MEATTAQRERDRTVVALGERRGAPKVDTYPAQAVDDALAGILTILTELAGAIESIAEVVAFVQKASPVIDELTEALPKLRAFAALGEQVSKGGIGGLFALMRSSGE